MPWYDGPDPAGACWRPCESSDEAAPGPFRMPVQWVNRPDADFRGFAGRIASGAVAPGDAVRDPALGRRSRRSTGSSPSTATCDEAGAGQSVTLTLADEVDVSRGDVIAAADAPPEVADQFEADVVWMAEAPLLPGRAYWLKLGRRDRPRPGHRHPAQGQRRHPGAAGGRAPWS